MKRKDLLKKIREAGFTIKEGGEHSKVYRGSAMLTEVPRHTEINELTAKAILKKLGLQ